MGLHWFQNRSTEFSPVEKKLCASSKDSASIMRSNAHQYFVAIQESHAPVCRFHTSCDRIRVGGEKGRVITRQVTTGTGQGNQADAAMHFGLGDHSGEVTLEILWPGNRRQSVKTPVDRVVTVKFSGK